MVIFLLLLLMFENFLEEGQSVLAESPKMANATPSTNLKAETRPLFPRGLPYSPSPFNVKQFLWPSFTPLKKRKRELSGWIQVGVHLLESSPSLNLSNGAEMNKQRIPKHLYFGLNTAPCQVFAKLEKNNEIDKNCGRQTSPLQAAPLYCTSSNAHPHPGLACSALPPHPPIPQITPPCTQAPTANAPSEAKGGLTGGEMSLSVFNPFEQVGVLRSPYSVFPLLLLLIYDSTKRIELTVAKDVQDIPKTPQILEKTYRKRLDDWTSKSICKFLLQELRPKRDQLQTL